MMTAMWWVWRGDIYVACQKLGIRKGKGVMKILNFVIPAKTLSVKSQ